MNRSNFVHAGFALAFQAIVGLLFGAWLWGGVAAALFFLGREVAQREYHLTAGASVKGLRPWEGFDVLNWKRDAQFDLLLPVVAVTAGAIVGPMVVTSLF